MSKIILRGVDQVSMAMLGRDAFTKPDADKELHFSLTTDHELYQPHLVKVLSQEDGTLHFRGVDLEDPDRDFGPDPARPEQTYTVELGQVKHVYREKPSTLAGLEPGGAKSYAVLFLSDAYVQSNDAARRLRAASGSPKWPASASIVDELRRQLKERERLYEALKAKQERAAQELRAFLSGLSLNSSQKSRVDMWLENFVKEPE